MLRIKRIGLYSVPRYPRGIFAPWREPAALTLIKKGAASAALLAILESCDDGVGVTGPPPVPPDLLTENEARAVITNVFTNNGIQPAPDVIVSIIGSQDDTTEVTLDGYNGSLSVGYEYVAGEDADTFTTALIATIDANTAGSGPYIKATGPAYSSSQLEYLMRAFIDTLKAQGKI